MKRCMSALILFVSVVFLCSNANATDRQEFTQSLKQYLIEEYGSVADSPVSTGILYDLVAPLSGIERFDGSSGSPTVTLKQWLQLSHEMKRAALVESSMPSHKDLRETGRVYARDHVYPIAILDFNYNRVRQTIPFEEVWQFERGKIVSVNRAVLEEQRLFAVSALYDRTYRGSEVCFRIDDTAFYFTNNASDVRYFEIDLDNGSGYRRIDSNGDVIAQYGTMGVKTVRVRVVQSDETVLEGSFRFEVRSLDTPDPHEIWQVQATTPYMGIYAAGEAYVYLSDQHSTLTNPLIMVEGLDLDNSLNWDELYELLNQEDLIETLREMGYDAIVLNYTESTTYVQANAFLVMELVQQVNEALSWESSSVLVGASMGGLTTRYALTYMEANALPHNIRTLITFDSPHSGADIPLGIQYWTDFFASESADAEALRDALNTPAARQLLVTHFTDPPSSTASCDPLHDDLTADLMLIGNYPTQPRKVSVVNGSGTMQGSGFNPGDQLILYEYTSLLVNITGNVWALNDAQSQLIFEGEIDLPWPLPDESMNVTVQPTWPWDNAPGGLTYSMQTMDETEAPYGDIIALYPSHCFIPTISALDLNVSDPFYNIAGEPDLYALTPFDSVYFPVENQDHVAITPENYWWFMQEIVDSLPAPEVTAVFDQEMIRLQWQPILGARSYRIYSTDDLQVWPDSYTLIDSTTWTETPASDFRYFCVTSSMEPVPSR